MALLRQVPEGVQSREREGMIDCSKCKHYRPNEVLIGKPDWWCDRYKRLMSDWTIGCNFSCNGFEEAKE